VDKKNIQKNNKIKLFFQTKRGFLKKNYIMNNMIKKIRFFIPFLFLMTVCTFANAQNSIVNSNNSWAVLHYGFGEIMIPCCVSTDYVYFDGDSLFNNNTYKKVLVCTDELHSQPVFTGLIREDNQKVYYIPENSTNEFLLYDFSLAQGNTVELTTSYYYVEDTFTFYVNQVDFVEINGINLKRMQLTDVPPYNNYVYDTWIESIGSLNGFFNRGIRPTGGSSNLLCYSKNNEIFYQNPLFAECYYDNNDLDYLKEILSSVSEIENNDFSIYPNPVSDILVLSSSETVSDMEIFNSSGQKVYFEQLKNNQNEIVVSFLTKGLYVLKIHKMNGQTLFYKFVKK
jgi:hypothetical protein